MSTTIQIKRSSTASGVPLATDLAVGELAVNLADKRLFTKQSDGTIIELSTNPTDLDAATLRIDGVEITASATELNKLDGFTGSTTELNILDGLTATTIELNTLDGITASTAELNKLDGYTGSTAELNILDGVTATTAEINKLDGFTGTVADLNYAKDLRATGVTTTEFDKLDGLTATTTELNYVDGVTSNIQTQLNGKATSAQGALADSAVQPNDNVTFGTGDFTGSVDVTGTVTADGLTFGANTGRAINLYESGSDVYGLSMDNLGDGFSTNVLGGEAGLVKIFTKPLGGSTAERLRVKSNGDVSFYEDTGTTAKFVWDASAESLGIGTASPTGKLDINISSNARGYFTDNIGEVGAGTFTLQTLDSTGALLKPLGFRAEDIRFATGSSERMRIDSSGNVALTGNEQELKFHSDYAIGNTDRAKIKTVGAGGGSGYGGDLTFHTKNPSNVYGERMRIDSSGNVGIGTASPDSKLEVVGGVTVGSFSGNGYRISRSGLSLPIIEFGTQDLDILSIINPVNNHLVFGTNATERARIDSSGNLLVGRTNSATGNSGLVVYSNGLIKNEVSNDTVCVHNRIGNDGDITQFRKDGSTVGSIGTEGGALTIGNGDTGLRFISVSDGVQPFNPSSNSTRDASVDLGFWSNRFKDLYLSGGVYLGGTGAANKLDDYETGNWTPTVSFTAGNGTLSYNTQVGYYIKTGSMVSVHLHISFNKGTASGNFRISSLPFTVANTQAARGGASVGYYNGINNVNSNPLFMGDNNTTILSARKPDGIDINQADLNAVTNVWMQYTYYTDS